MKLCSKRLTVNYGNKTILKRLSLELKQGEFVCLCGPNGSGKSTLLRNLCALENPKNVYEGNICFEADEEQSLFSLNRREISRRIGFMEQTEICAWDMLVSDVILSGRYSIAGGFYTAEDKQKVQEAAALLGITELLQRNVYSLSGGEFQKVRIARAVCGEPSFLLLDEPCAPLDYLYEAELLEFLKKLSHEKNMGILITIHDINAACRFADKLMLLCSEKDASSQQLIYGSAEAIINQETLEAVFNKKVQIYTHPVFGCKQMCQQ